MIAVVDNTLDVTTRQSFYASFTAKFAEMPHTYVPTRGANTATPNKVISPIGANVQAPPIESFTEGRAHGFQMMMGAMTVLHPRALPHGCTSKSRHRLRHWTWPGQADEGSAIDEQRRYCCSLGECAHILPPPLLNGNHCRGVVSLGGLRTLFHFARETWHHVSFKVLPFWSAWCTLHHCNVSTSHLYHAPYKLLPFGPCWCIPRGCSVSIIQVQHALCRLLPFGHAGGVPLLVASIHHSTIPSANVVSQEKE